MYPPPPAPRVLARRHFQGREEGHILKPSTGGCLYPPSQEPRKGGFGKGVSAELSVTPKETENTQGDWAPQYIWHSERHSQEGAHFAQNPSKKTLFLVPDPPVNALPPLRKVFSGVEA